MILKCKNTASPPQWYLVEVLELPWSDDPGSNADGSIATGRASCAVQVKGDEPDKKGYTGPPGWGLDLEAHNLTSIQIKILFLRSLIMDAGWVIVVRDQEKLKGL